MPYPIRQGDIPGVQLRYECELDASSESVLLWLTDPVRLSAWLAREVEALDDGDGGWLLRGADADGTELSERMRRLPAADPSADDRGTLTYSFERLDAGWESATRLVLRITGEDPCVLTVLQDGFQRLSLSRCLPVWEAYRRRWRSAFAALEREIAGAEGRHSDT